jgi:hypothetical protein
MAFDLFPSLSDRRLMGIVVTNFALFYDFTEHVGGIERDDEEGIRNERRNDTCSTLQAVVSQSVMERFRCLSLTG